MLENFYKCGNGAKISDYVWKKKGTCSYTDANYVEK